MSLRGISETMTDLVLNFGMPKVILNRKGIDAFLLELEQLKKCIKSQGKGGLVVVDVNDCLLTTYSLVSYNRSCH